MGDVTREDRSAAVAYLDTPDGDSAFDRWASTGDEALLPDYFPSGDMPGLAAAFRDHREAAVAKVVKWLARQGDDAAIHYADRIDAGEHER